MEGVYGYLRHPSYLGFYMYVVGIQVYVCNYGCLMISMIMLRQFMKQRIQFEEYWLVKHHPQYQQYRQQVGVYIPFI